MGLDLDGLDAAGLTGDLDAADRARLTSVPDTPTQAPSTTQRVTIVMEGGDVYDVTLDARDRRAYALHQDRYRLPAFTLDPTAPTYDVLKLELLTMFSAWWATRHRLKLHGLDWPAFNAAAVELVTHPDVEVDAHPLAPGAG